MTKLTIGRMAKLYGLHRSTLYEAVAKGRVTAGFNGKGQRVIELSEMIRLYGEAPGLARQNPTSAANTYPTHEKPHELLDELRALRQEMAALREEVHELRTLPTPGQLAAHPDDTKPLAPAPPDPVTTDTPPRDFGDLLARLEVRNKSH